MTDLSDGLPPEAKAVLALQFKARWTKADKAKMADLTLGWTQVHKQVFEDRFGPLLPAFMTIRWK